MHGVSDTPASTSFLDMLEASSVHLGNVLSARFDNFLEHRFVRAVRGPKHKGKQALAITGIDQKKRKEKQAKTKKGKKETKGGIGQTKMTERCKERQATRPSAACTKGKKVGGNGV